VEEPTDRYAGEGGSYEYESATLHGRERGSRAKDVSGSRIRKIPFDAQRASGAS
jgi:hypothetical protein